jgi:hypothetical protein
LLFQSPRRANDDDVPHVLAAAKHADGAGDYRILSVESDKPCTRGATGEHRHSTSVGTHTIEQ